MSDQVETQIRDGVALVILKRPGGNALVPALRAELAAALQAAIDAPEVSAIVLCGAGQGFSSGVSLTEYDQGLSEPWVGTICTLIENSPKPVVCATHGMALGAGLELALAAHARVVHRDARLALPDVQLGLTPGSGGTQRLTRLVGAQLSLEILLTGKSIDAADRRFKKVVTRLTDGSPTAVAVTVARDLAARGSWRRTRDATKGLSDPMAFQNAVAAVRSKIGAGHGVEGAVLRCIEAAQLLPFEQGLAFEYTLFLDRLTLPEVRGPRHILMAESQAARVPAGAKRPPAPIRSVGLIGGGALATELAILFCDAGLEVHLKGVPEQIRALRAGVQKWFDGAQARGRITPQQTHACVSRLVENGGGEQACDLVIRLEGAADDPKEPPPHQLRLSAGEARTDVQAEAGHLHFPRPAHGRPIAEYRALGAEDADTIARLKALFARMGRSLICGPVCGEGLEARLRAGYFTTAQELLLQGVQERDVDAAGQSIGFAQGPRAMMGGTQDQTKDSRTGGMTQDRLQGALLAGVVNAACGALTERAAAHPLEVDLMAVKGLGFQRSKGGPLLQADMRGLFPLYKQMQELAQLSPLWAPHARIEEMVKNGQGFFGRGIEPPA